MCVFKFSVKDFKTNFQKIDFSTLRRRPVLPAGRQQTVLGCFALQKSFSQLGCFILLVFLLLLIFLSKSYADVFLYFFVKVPILSCLKLNFLRLPRKDDIKFRVSHFFFVLFSFSYRFTSSERVSVFDRGVVERLFGKF